jgi:hypothetical protein
MLKSPQLTRTAVIALPLSLAVLPHRGVRAHSLRTRQV